MASPRDLRRRIRSIGSTAQITRAMQMVAASKMRRAQQAAIESAPFARRLYRMQRAATARIKNFRHPLLAVRPVHKRAVILIAGDKGLCGALNTNVFKLASQFDTATTVFITAGKKAAQFVARSGRTLAAEFEYHDSPTFAEARAIARVAREMMETGQVDEVRIVSTRYVNTLTQEPVSLEYLPVGQISSLKVPGVESDDPFIDDAEVSFEPSPEAVLTYLVGHYLDIYIYYTLLSAKASEQSARMVSMKNATDSAETLIKELQLEYNKLRQGNITKELLEIAGGQAE